MRGLVPADLAGQLIVGQLDLAAGGRVVAYTLRTGRHTEIWVVDTDHAGAHPVRVTTGHTDTSPRWSPDGRTLAFLRATGDAPAQAMRWQPGAAGPAPVTDFAQGVAEFCWAADGAALVAAVPDGASTAVAAADLPGEAPVAYLIRSADWRRDGMPSPQVRTRHLHRAPLDGGPAVRLTDGSRSASRPRATADAIYYLADHGPDADLYPAPQVFRVGASEPVTALAGGVDRYHVTDAGLRVLGHVRLPRSDSHPPRWFDIDAEGSVTPLPAAPGVWLGLLGDETDLHDWSVELDDCAQVSTLSRAGRTVPADPASGAPVLDLPVITGATTHRDGVSLAVLCEVGRGPDIYALGPGAPRRITDHGDWLADRPMPSSEWIEVDGPGGPIGVHVLGGVPGAPKPGVLLIHGGPTGQWGVVPSLEALLLASAGFTVAMPNIRGSIDRGADWVAGLAGDWGGADAADVHAVCDHLVGSGRIDARRFGVSGLSYGGFLVNWLVGTTDRFAAAVSENGVTNQVSAWGGCDTGPQYCRMAELGDPLTADGVDRLWRTSPLRNVARVSTPLLMLQGLDDGICPASDNEQFFVALRALGRQVDYVLYPEESHLMQAIGRLDRRIDRHTRVIAWFTERLAA